MKRIFLSVATLVVLAVAGCRQLDYVGQCFAPLPESEPVNFVRGKENVSLDDFREIGHGTLQLPERYDSYDIRDMLVEAARERGANVVCVVSSQRVAVGINPRERGSYAPPNPNSMNHGNINANGERIQVNAFGQMNDPIQSETIRYEVLVKAVFFKNRQEFDRLMAERKKQLERYCPAKSVAPPVSAKSGTTAVAGKVSAK